MTQEAPAKRRNLNRVLTYLKPEVRYVIDQIGEGEQDDTRAETIRELVLHALNDLGYDADKIREEYLRFALRCAESKEENPYEEAR